MCGRACCSLAPEQIRQVLGFSGPWRNEAQFQPSFNAGPGSNFPVIFSAMTTHQREMATMSWGLVPYWSRAGNSRCYKSINARAETLDKKPSFKHLLPQKRCAIVVEGFFEWAPPLPSTTSKQPFYLYSKKNQLLTLAALYDCWIDSKGHELWTFTIVTTDAPKDISWIHERMPVILNDSTIDVWVQSDQYPVDAALSTLKPCSQIDYYPVSHIVNNMQNDRPECIHQITLRLKRKAGNTCQDSFPQKLTKANKDKTRCALSAAFRPGKEEEEEEENTKSFGWTRKDIESRRAMHSINSPKPEQQLIKEEGDPAAETQVTPAACWWSTCESSPSSRFSGATGSADMAPGNLDFEPYSEGERGSEESSISLDDDDDDFPYYLVPDPSTTTTTTS